jgi:hypothetical protein
MTGLFATSHSSTLLRNNVVDRVDQQKQLALLLARLSSGGWLPLRWG